MKKYLTLFVALACASLALIGCSTNSSTTASAGSPNDGHLTVNRIANFGGITTVIVSVDGKKVATIPRGQTYDGYFPPGHHTLSATVEPNNLNSPVWSTTLNVAAGKTYSFTAVWKADRMVLVQN